MEERLALQVSSFAELEGKLGRYLQNPHQEGGDWYRGQVKQYKEMVALFSSDEELQKVSDRWLQQGKYEKLLSWWVKGLKVDWQHLYGKHLPHRISLPTYPFARERYWISTSTVEMHRNTHNHHKGSSQQPLSPMPMPTESLTATTIPSLVPLHPLVQQNISDFFEQRFSSTFHGEEFFLVDHVVKGQHIMPGVAYLEMARVAVAQAVRSLGATEEGHILTVGPVYKLRHVVWARPLTVGEHPITVHITLSPQENGAITFHIGRDGVGRVSDKEAIGREQASHLLCQGTALVGQAHKLQESAITSQSLDLPAVQARCLRQVSAIDCYQRYSSLGIDYGPALRGIEQLSIGEDEVLARLRLPVAPGRALTYAEEDRRDGLYPYVLHPSVLDAALQACIGLLTEEHQNPQLPFVLDELEIVGVMPAQGWAWVRRRAVGIVPCADPATDVACGRGQARTLQAPQFDIEVCDDEGRIAVRLRGLSSRVLLAADVLDAGADAPRAKEQSVPLGNTQEEDKLLSYIPRWDPVVLSQPAQAPERPVGQGAGVVPEDPPNQVVIVGGTPDEQSAIMHFYPHADVLEIPMSASIEQIAQWLSVGLGLAPNLAPTALHVFWLAPHTPQLSLTQESLLAAQQQGVMTCFRLIKALLQLGYGSRTLRWTVITRQTRTLYATETGHPTHASLLGLFGSLAKEYAHWSIQQIDLPAGVPLPLSEIHYRLPADPQGHGWLYRNGHWYRQILVPLDVSSCETREAYRRGGVYVVIGGAGGIGEVVSEYLIHRYQAQMIWIGRRKSDAEILAKQERLATLGPRPHYITADASNQSALRQAYQEIKRSFGQIHGVIHSAIVLQDQSLANMDEERFRAALVAKVEVSVRLAQVFEHEPLDFVLFFSSLNAFTRNAGQSNYAAGSTFEDAFAAQLGRDWSCRVKVMNWSYWGSVGVVASQEYRERMAQIGVGSIEPAEAMEALEHLLAGPVDQMVLLKTTQPVAAVRMPEEPRTESAADRIGTRHEVNTRHDPHPAFGTIPTVPVGEMITVYPERFPSSIHSLDNYRPP
jgi:acyl transferase domain-containing protein